MPAIVRAYRICKAKYAATALDGAGARRRGGRWGPIRFPMAYASATISLAALENLVHMDPEEARMRYVSIELKFPEALVETVDVRALPADWREIPAPAALQALGAAWAESARSAVLRVPSALVPTEWNYLVNPNHPDLWRIALGPPAPFAFDLRLLKRAAR